MDYQTYRDTFLKLYYSGVNKINLNIELSDEETEIYLKLAKFHSLEMVLYEAYKINNIKISPEFNKLHQQLLYKHVTQIAELNEISNHLSLNKIYHLPLKGSVLYAYYTDPSLRTMADLDILIQEKDLNKAGEVLKEIGYSVEQIGGNHDVYYKKPFMNIELHRQMISQDYNTSKVFANIWDKIDLSNYHCKLTNEDFFIYIILHAGKHFLLGGAGLRFLMDLYFYLLKEKNLDFAYINQKLEEIGYDTFTKIFIDIETKLFKGNFNFNEDELFILDYLIKSGTYGTYEHSAAIGIENEKEKIGKGKTKFFFKRVFPSYSTMARMYPKLAKHKILLPYYYIKRIFKVIFKSKTYKEQLRSINNVEEKDLQVVKKIQNITKLRSINE